MMTYKPESIAKAKAIRSRLKVQPKDWGYNHYFQTVEVQDWTENDNPDEIKKFLHLALDACPFGGHTKHCHDNIFTCRIPID